MATGIEPFVYLPTYPFIVCKKCKVGFVTSEVINHLKSKHGHISRTERQRIKQTVATYASVAKDQAELRGWASPPPTTKPNQHIKPAQEDGLGCVNCPYVVRDVQQMQKHCREQHGWVNHQKRGGQHQARQEGPAVPWRGGVCCQQICHWGHGRRWFEVGRAEGGIERREGPAEEEDGFKDAVKFFNRVYREDEEAFESEAKARIQNADDKWEAETWLNRCGWARHLAGVGRDELRALLQPIGDDEPVLQKMWEVFEEVLDDAYAAASRCHPGTAELFEIERKEAHITTTKPFQGLMEPDAWERYKAWWRTLMSIWKRLESWRGDCNVDDSSEDSSSDGNSEGFSRKDSPPRNPPPPYRMTIRQEELWKAFDNGVRRIITGAGGTGRYTEEVVKRSCLDAVVQFFDHPFRNGNHYESIIISALAIMGVDREDGGGGWVPVVNYTPIYSAVIKVARYLVLHQSMLERQGQKIQLQQYMSAREAEEQAEGLFRIVRRKVRRFMTRVPEGEETDPTPMDWIINTRTYGMRIRFTTPGNETIDWRGDKIIHGRVRLGMGEISDMLHSLVMDARRTLVQLATGRVEKEEEEEEEEEEEKGGRKEKAKTTADNKIQMRSAEDEEEAVLPRIPWSQIEDRHGESELEHSFLRNEDNKSWTRVREGWVKQQIAASPERFKAWMSEPSDEQNPYRERAVRAYARALEKFRGQMFVLMHMLGGQPARATEILGLRMWNTANGGIRNIFIQEGMVCFVTMYHKGFRRTGSTKIIHRYLPREVGELLVWYMWLVLPFWQAIQGRVKQKRRRSAFLWADEVVSEHGGKEGKGRFKIKAEKAEEGERQEREEEEAFMEWYRESKWTSDRARRAMQRYSARFSGQEVNISAWRQMAIGISNRYFNKVFGPDGEDEDEEQDGDGNLFDSIHDLQAGHGSHIAGLIYARLFGQGELGTMRSREKFRKVSMQWHRFFGFGAEDGVEQLGSKRVRCGFDDERDATRRSRFGRLHRVDMRGQLRQMMGPSAAFRGLQETVIRAVASGEWPIVQVTPTGGGKSLTFMLPAYCTPDGVTVVVTPLVALENDMVERCVKLGIDAYVWRSREVQRAASLVFVTPESAVSKGFRMFVERMHGQQKLDRVVVDECHTAMRYSKTFRPQIGRLGETLQDFGVPVVCLTATLKPAREMAFFRQMRFMPEQVHMFREATTRPNIEYRVDVMEDNNGNVRQAAANIGRRRGRSRSNARGVKVNAEGEEEGGEDDEDEALLERACEIVRTWTRGHKQGKVIVYGGTIKRVEGIADRLGCMAYWRGVGNAAEKAQRLAEWKGSSGGEGGWVAATNALGLGIDDPNVRLVVHIGMPRQLEDFVQESGRGGRDGQKSESVVVIRRSWLRQQTDEDFQQRQRQRQEQGQGQDEWAWDKDAIEFAKGQVCRREVLDREMDGNIDRFGCGEGEEMCDVCQHQHQQQQRTVGNAVTEEAEGVEHRALRETDEITDEITEEVDFEKSRRLVRQVETERMLQVMQEAKEVGEFEDLLAEWVGCCMVCKIAGEGEDPEHAMESCRHRGTERWAFCNKGYEQVQKEMIGLKRFASYAACFDCGVPQEICNRWVAASDDGRSFRRADGRACQYGDGLIFQIMAGQRIRGEAWWIGQMEKMMGRREEGERGHEYVARLYSWLGELIEWGGKTGGGIQASRLCQVIIRIEQAWKGGHR